MIVARCQWSDGHHIKDIMLADDADLDTIQMPVPLFFGAEPLTFVREHETVPIEDHLGNRVVILRALLSIEEALGILAEQES